MTFGGTLVKLTADFPAATMETWSLGKTAHLELLCQERTLTPLPSRQWSAGARPEAGKPARSREDGGVDQVSGNEEGERLMGPGC